MFAQFVNQCGKGAVLQDEVYALIKEKIKPGLQIRTFGSSAASDIVLRDYKSERGASFADFGSGYLQLPAPGRHTAMNVAATALLLEILNHSRSDALTAALKTQGVARRFDFKGRTANGAAVYDDYAHNPEKVANILAAAQELTGSDGKVLAFFQPHGYGPFGFMAEELGCNLAKLLRKDDRFYLAEPFYAGGTSSFSPHAEDVFKRWQS
jgi:UDP-N-acetylmuramate--alanine ligase